MICNCKKLQFANEFGILRRVVLLLSYLYGKGCAIAWLFLYENGEVINRYAFVAQLAERLICNQNVVGSSPIGSFGVEQFGVATEL